MLTSDKGGLYQFKLDFTTHRSPYGSERQFTPTQSATFSDRIGIGMAALQRTRRWFAQTAVRASVLALFGCNLRKAETQGDQSNQTMVTLYTFGDSILDCARYNEFSVHPGQLLVHNNDRLFPEFHGQDLQSLGPARLEHRARDGSTVEGLPAQARGLQTEEKAIALITIGGNDLLQGLIWDTNKGIEAFAHALDTFVKQLPIRPVLLGNVYDPTLGDDKRNFLGIEPAIARKNFERMNSVIQGVANRYGQLVDLHGHFLRGDASWFTATIEPSLKGASEVRRAFLPYVMGYRKNLTHG